MKERLTIGFIVVFLALAIQDGLFSTKADYSTSTTNSSALVIASREPSIIPSETRVVRVVDGDTIVVQIKGVQEKVRFIGVDTPETVDPRGSVQCFGEEASAFTKSILENQVVRLESDSSQGDRDKFGRLLRYVYHGDTLINKKIIIAGYGHEYTYHVPYMYQEEFREAEILARKSQRGLWAKGVCGS